MNCRQLVVANVHYRKPTLEGTKQTKGLLRYYTYRDGRVGQVIQKPGLDRWVDRGLGQTMTAIAATCEQLKGEHVLAFTVVINPNPELVQMVPMAARAQFVRDLTETTLDRFFEARGIETGVESSYVFHHRDSTNPQSPGLHNPHTHVLLPGTYYDEGKGERVPLYFSRNRKVDHIDLLHRSAEASMAQLLDHYVGHDWEKDFDKLEAVREQQKAIVDTLPHFEMSDEQGNTRGTWLGVRRTTMHHSAVGFYRHYSDDKAASHQSVADNDLKLEFRPLIRGLTHSRAELLADLCELQCRQHQELPSDTVFQMVQSLAALRPQVLEQQYAQFLPQGIEESHEQETDLQREFDIDF